APARPPRPPFPPRRSSDLVRAEGLTARFGGDAFLVVCGIGDDSSRPERIADAILDAFGDSFRFDNEEFAITASIGIARTPDDGRSEEHTSELQSREKLVCR